MPHRVVAHAYDLSQVRRVASRAFFACTMLRSHESTTTTPLLRPRVLLDPPSVSRVFLDPPSVSAQSHDHHLVPPPPPPQGMAKTMSLQFLGKQIDAIYHTCEVLTPDRRVT